MNPASIFDNIYNHIVNLDNDIIHKDLEQNIGKQLIKIYSNIDDEELQGHIEKTIHQVEYQRHYLKEIFLKFLDNVYSIGNKSKLFEDYKQSKYIDAFFEYIVLPGYFNP